MTALFVAGFEDRVATGPGAADCYRVFVISAHLRPEPAAPPDRWLVEARRQWPYPDQRCSVAWERAAALGFDVAPHYATDAAGERFLPGTSFETVVGIGAPDPERAGLEAMAAVGTPLRSWLSALRAAFDDAAGDLDRTVWPPAPAELAGMDCRVSPENIALLRERQAATQRESAAAQAATLREQNADAIYMPHNIG